MKDLLSKEHYCYKLYIEQLSANLVEPTSFSINNPLYGTHTPFLQEIFDLPIYDFSETQAPYK